MEKKKELFTRNASGLVRELSWWDVFLMVIAAPAASGILYYSVSTAAAYPGGNIAIAFTIGTLLFLPIALFIGMMSATMPRSGSLYVAVSRLVDPSVAFLAAILFFIGYGLTIGVLGHIVTGILGGVFVAGGLAAHNDALTTIGEHLQMPLWQTVGAFLWVALIWFVTLKGLQAFRRTMKLLFFLPLLASLITIAYFILTSSTGAAVGFDQTWGSGAYQKILDLARANEWSFPAFSWSETFGLLLVVLWAFGGFEMVAYAGSEIKSPRISMMKGYLWGWLALGSLYVLLSFAVYKPFNEFIGAYDFLYNNHKEALQQIMPLIRPSVPFYLQSIVGSPWVGIILSVSLVMWFVNTMPPFFLANSRLIMALSLDKAVPEKLAEVNPRTNSPTWATHLTAVFAVLGVIFNALDVGVVLGTINFSIWFVVWMYGLSAMLLPYRRPDIFATSPVQWRIAGIPVISVVGLFVFIEGWFFVFISLAALGKAVMLALVIIMGIGMVVHLIQLAKNRRNGIDMTKIYSSIPAE